MPKLIIKLILLVSLSSLSSCLYIPKSKNCYWMENHSGNHNWIIIDDNLNKQDCYRLDSCNGGLGMSLGGCYKWSSAPEQQGEIWY